MLKRDTVFDMDKFLHGSAEQSGGAWRLTGQRRDAPASGTLKALCGCVCQRPGVHRPCIPEPLPLLGHPLWLLSIRRESSTVPVCCPSPAPGAHWQTMHVQPSFCIGRYVGTALLLGRREPYGDCSALTCEGDRASIRVWCGPIGVHLRTEIKSGHVTDCRRR